MLNTLRILFPRPVRASLYAVGLALDAGLIVDGRLPAWSAVVAAPLLLALLHLSPKDVDPAPKQD